MKKTDLPLFESIWSQSGLNQFKHSEGKFNSYYAPFCIYPLSSPVFGKGRFTKKDIENFELYFKTKRKGQKPFIFFEGRVDLKNWEERGYQAKEVNVCYLANFSKDVELPLGYSFEIIKFNSKRGKDIYKEVACKVFSLGEKFLNGFHKLCKMMSQKNHLIVIYNRNKIPVALVGVVCSGKVGFLHSACVLPRYQGKGISGWFLENGLSFIKNLGAEHLIYTSSNIRMISSSNYSKKCSFILKL